MNTKELLEKLDNGTLNVAEIEPPAGMWDRFVARLEAEEAEAPAQVRVKSAKPVLVRGLALVPTR